jgi:hypothetical protein
LSVQTQRAQPGGATDRAHEIEHQVEKNAGLGAAWLARVGLTGRGIFYLVLVYITVQVALLGYANHQADTNGALATITRPTVGRVAVGVVALGFVCFGVECLLGGWRDGRSSPWRRALATGRGLFFLGLAAVPVAYLAGNHKVGSEQQQDHTAARILSWPGGQELVALLGVVVICICGTQIYTAVRRNPVEQMNLAHQPRLVGRVVRIVAGLGIAARATVVLPVGVFLLIAAIEFNPNRAKGLDGELATLARFGWGRVVIFGVALGLSVFAIFSFLDARFHDFETD